ncbi:helix-turn-helix domain-containing protein [Streptomyces coffeae]|uniref:Helix-turn-helix domain-containing protein n=1 Tax=Streptomyces coffeae TaxID=621382 RepID=A0ABS1N9M8_9ACTN|nr:helix-turn-helix domain-containing protein [Streptomyces coffeae]MBL1096784.1 helix-turn-helix domain-containing protein [Streptomyces coffeae]
MGQLAQHSSAGEAISAARRARGWTQQQLADMCGYSQSTISRLERGRQSARDVDVLALVADRLGMAPSQVGLAGNTPHNADVNRRDFLGTTTAAAAGLAILPAASSTTRRPVNPAVVGHLQQLRATLVQSDGLYGPHAAISAVHDHLAVIEQQLLPAARRPLRREILQTGAEWAEFAGWLYEDLGRPEEALWWSDRAMEWVQEADDPVRQAFILMRKAQQSVGLGQQQRAVGLASAALRVRGDVPARIRASAHLQAAHGHALIGGELPALRALDAAQTLVEGDETVSDQLGGYCNHAYVHAQRATCYLKLGKPTDAVTTYQQAIDHWPAIYQRERGLHLARLATAHAADRAPDAACATAMAALEISRETESRRTTAELRRVVTGLAPWRRNAMVRELSEAVAAV